MPLTGEAKKAANRANYLRNQSKRKLEKAITGILGGGKPSSSTLEAFGWDESKVNKIRALNKRFKVVLEEEHGIDLDRLYAGKEPLDPIDMPHVNVRVAPVAPPIPKYEQCLDQTPDVGNHQPITWAQVITFWSGPVEKHAKGNTAPRRVLNPITNEYENEKYAESYRKDVIRTFRQVMNEYAKATPDDDAIPTLKDALGVIAFLKSISQKTQTQQEADKTEIGSVNAVAGKDDSEDEEVSSGGPIQSSAGERPRARLAAPELKKLTQTYSKKLGHISTTFSAWKVFRDALGTRVHHAYQIPLNVAIQADKEVQSNKATSDLHAVPSYEMLQSYIPKIKEKFGETSPTYVAAYLQVNLLGLRDNLGGIEVLDRDGPVYKPGEGDESRSDWYNKESGRLYIAHFKTDKSRYGRPYDFKLPTALRNLVNKSLESDGRKFLVGIGRKIDGTPSPAGRLVKKAFKSAGLTFKQLNQGRLIDTSVTPVDVRHAQVTWKHKDMMRKNPSLTAQQISDKIAGFFNHSSDINIGYLRKTFDSIDDPLAKKTSSSPSESSLPPIAETPEPPTPEPPTPEPPVVRPAPRRRARTVTPTPQPTPEPRARRASRPSKRLAEAKEQGFNLNIF